MPDKDDLNPEKEEGYTKVDKRVTREAADAEVPDADAAQQPTDAAAEQAPAAKREAGADTLADVGVYGILRFCVGLLAQQAWIALGIVAPPGGETKQNLPEARVAIDTLALLVEQLKPDLDEAETREMNVTLADLRANYVRRAG